MKRAIILIVVAIITLTIVFIVYRPDLLEKIWLWIIGLAGPIIGFSKKGIQLVIKFIKSLDKSIENLR